jgi:hypothetical protein
MALSWLSNGRYPLEPLWPNVGGAFPRYPEACVSGLPLSLLISEGIEGADAQMMTMFTSMLGGKK